MNLSLTKTQKLQIKVARQELTPWGLSSSVEMGGKHPFIRVEARDGSQYRLTVSCTPRSSGHCLEHMRQNARRLVRLINQRAGY